LAACLAFLGGSVVALIADIFYSDHLLVLLRDVCSTQAWRLRLSSVGKCDWLDHVISIDSMCAIVFRTDCLESRRNDQTGKYLFQAT